MKNLIISMVFVWILSVVPSLAAQEKSGFEGAPDWVLRGENNGDQMCVVVSRYPSKTDKMTLERLVEQADLELCRNIKARYTGTVSKYENKKGSKQAEIMYSLSVNKPDISACAITEKRFVKDTWKSPDGYIMAALVCLPKSKDIAAEIEKRRAVTGKYWSDASREKMTWDDAKTYCENLKEGGFNDWRLPTIDELRSLVKNCKDTMTGGACRITDKCRTSSCFDDALSKSDCWCPKNQAQYSKLGDHGTFWSDSYYSPLDDACAHYVLNFDSGGIDESYFVLYALLDDSKSGKNLNCADLRNIPDLLVQNGADKLKKILEPYKESNISVNYLVEDHYVRCVR